MAKKYKCVFKRVNGDNTGSFARAGMSASSPIHGVLYMRKCPDGKTFYCDPNDGGTNNYYRLIDPQLYGLPNKTMYVCIDMGLNCFTSVTLIDDEETKQPTTEQMTNIMADPPQKPASSNVDASTISLTGGNNSGVITNASGSTVSDEIKGRYKAPLNRTGYFNDYHYEILSDLKILETNLNIVTTASGISDIKHQMLNKFNRYKIAFPDIQLTKSFAHVFFTRPDLNIYNSGGSGYFTLTSAVSNDPVYYYLDKNNPDLLKSLTKKFSSKHDLNPFLSNMARSFQLRDEELETDDTMESLTGHKIKYGMSNIKSKTANEFTIRYIDDNEYKVYKIHKAWIDYISKVYRGELAPKSDYVKYRILDYACSVYYFLCAEDGETILFWSKYTGVFPLNIPSAASSWTYGDLLKMPDLDITYAYGWKEDFNPVTLAEFNMNSGKLSDKKYAVNYEPELTSTGKTFVNAPFVETRKGPNGEYNFKLRFRK